MEKLEDGSPVVHMRNVLWIASIVLLPMVFLFEKPLQIDINHSQVIYIIILGIFHAGIVYMLYNLLIQEEGALFASFSNYINPVIGVILGYIILKDPLFLQHKIGILIILFFNNRARFCSKELRSIFILRARLWRKQKE